MQGSGGGRSTRPGDFFHLAAQRPEVTALIDPVGRNWSRGELLAEASRIRNALASMGAIPESNIALICPNSADFLIVYLGVTMLGASLVPVNWHLTAEEIRHILHTARSAFVFAHESMQVRVQAILESMGGNAPRLIAIHARAPTGSFRCGIPPDSSPVAPAPEFLGRTMLFTSATTGKPKAISFPRRNGYEALGRVSSFHESFGIRPDSGAAHLCVSMLYHSAPLEGAVTTLHAGNVVVLHEKWDSHRALEAIQRHQVAAVFLVPMMMVQLSRLSREERGMYDLSSLKMVVHAAAPCPVEVKREVIGWLGPIVYEGYGASEGSGTFVDSREWLAYPGTVGKPIPGSRIEIRDENGKLVPAGCEGLIYIKPYTGDQFEYLDEPEKTRACYCGDVYTAGDIGFLNDAGFLFVRDRKVDMVISGGLNIYPAEIEAVLIMHPKVRDCAVVGLPHSTLGELVHAVVEPAEYTTGDDRALIAELVRYLYPRLVASKLPRSFEFVRELPRDPNGKLLKRRLKENIRERSVVTA